MYLLNGGEGETMLVKDNVGVVQETYDMTGTREWAENSPGWDGIWQEQEAHCKGE